MGPQKVSVEFDGNFRSSSGVCIRSPSRHRATRFHPSPTPTPAVPARGAGFIASHPYTRVWVLWLGSFLPEPSHPAATRVLPAMRESAGATPCDVPTLST